MHCLRATGAIRGYFNRVSRRAGLSGEARGAANKRGLLLLAAASRKGGGAKALHWEAFETGRAGGPALGALRLLLGALGSHAAALM